MTRRRLHARLLSEYLDARLSSASTEPSGGKSGSARTPFDANLDLARELGDLDLRPPANFAPRLLERLRRLPPEAARRPWWSRWTHRPLHASNGVLAGVPGWVAGSLLAIAAVVLVVLGESSLGRITTASAEEVLRLNDAGLERLAEPGHWLYRRWRVSVRNPNNPALERTEQVVSEWADGDDPALVAGQGAAVDGRLLWRYVTVKEGTSYRGHVYFTPEYPGPERASLYLRPTEAELAEAFRNLPASIRDRLGPDFRYLTSDFYVPIISDRRFNMWALEVRDRPESLFGAIDLQMDQVADGNGRKAYRVRMVRPLAFSFRWAPDGVTVKVGRRESVKDISSDRFITLRATLETRFPDGSTSIVSHTSEELRAVPAHAGGDAPFDLHVPPNTPVYRQSASETLQAIVHALAIQGKVAQPRGGHVLNPLR